MQEELLRELQNKLNKIELHTIAGSGVKIIYKDDFQKVWKEFLKSKNITI